MPVVAIIQHKGGSGKSTAALGLSLASVIDRPSRPVVLVDLDPQRTVSTWVNDHNLRAITVAFTVPPEDGSMVFVDTPGLNVPFTTEAMVRADLVVVPIRATMFDWHVAKKTVKAILGAKKRGVWLPSQFEKKRAADEGLRESLQQAMSAGEIPLWPILPPIRNLAGVQAFLAGGAQNSVSAENFRDAFKAMAKELRKQ